ncbi:putative RNA-binding protein 23 [Porphyridium purpureum]|uniref:Putative RNA-binding protein 23 n=1 Tax=Porphyridium purpureum TaxID=35688 RepID=A0A5J4YTX1_PORPP|nr:putative RNA-binding protein 23 [Porphyridium purpureum]|eukprot:POR2459..scf227_4
MHALPWRYLEREAMVSRPCGNGAAVAVRDSRPPEPCAGDRPRDSSRPDLRSLITGHSARARQAADGVAAHSKLAQLNSGEPRDYNANLVALNATHSEKIERTHAGFRRSLSNSSADTNAGAHAEAERRTQYEVRAFRRGSGLAKPRSVHMPTESGLRGIVKLKRTRTTRGGRNSVKQRMARKLEREQEIRTVLVWQLGVRVVSKDLHALFSAAGHVIEIHMIPRAPGSQSHEGSAYVRFETIQGADRAVSFSGYLLKGYPIAVRRLRLPQAHFPSTPAVAGKENQTDLFNRVDAMPGRPLRFACRPEKPAAGEQGNEILFCLSGGELKISDIDLRALFSAVGPLVSFECVRTELKHKPTESRVSGSAKFQHGEDAFQAVHELSGSSVEGRPMMVFHASAA